MFQHWINTESYPVTQFCVNTLPAIKFTLITESDLIRYAGTNSPTGGGRSVGIVRSRTKATEFSLV
jgi:hypothetical protein